MKKTSLTITVLAGLLLAFAIIMGLRSCGHPDDIFAPGERVVDKVDWGQYAPGLFAGKVYTYARLQGKGDDKEATIIIIVPYPKDMNVSKDGLSSSGRDYIVKLKLESAMGRHAGVFELTLGGIPAKEFDRIVVQLAEGDHDVVLADADDESITPFAADGPIPIMAAQVEGTGAAIHGFLVLPTGGSYTPEEGTVFATVPDREVMTVKTTPGTGPMEVHFLAGAFSSSTGTKTLLLQDDHGVKGRSWSQTFR